MQIRLPAPCQPRLHAEVAMSTQRTMSWPKAAQWPSHGSRAQHCHRSHGADTCGGNKQVKESSALWCSVSLPFPHAILTIASMWRSWGLYDVVCNKTSLYKTNETNTCELTCSFLFAFPFLSQTNRSMLQLLHHTPEMHPPSSKLYSEHLRPEWLRGSRSHLQTSSRNPPIRAPHGKPHVQRFVMVGRICVHIFYDWICMLFIWYISMYSYHLSNYVQYDTYTYYFRHIMIIIQCSISVWKEWSLFWYSSCVQIEIWDSDAAILQLRLAQFVPDLSHQVPPPNHPFLVGGFNPFEKY